jgi:putative membrane protein insertion efficiency factor
MSSAPASALPPALALLGSLPRRLLLLAIWAYQVTIGLALPPACRFQPTCSRYAHAAIERHGALRGSWLAARRLARCHPFGGSGYDPVP